MAQSEPLVTIIVPHHLNENDDYLHWCLRSIKASDIPLEIIVLSDASKEPAIPVSVDGKNPIRIEWNKTLTNVTRKWHRGVRLADERSKYVMLISDDVMVTKYTIGEMARTIGDQQIILSPSSNCDSTTRYYARFVVGYGPDQVKEIGLKSTLDDIKGFEQAVIDRPPSQTILIDPGWISFYCTMFPKSVVKAVGDFDERLDVRYNDVDYCQRARALGIPSLVHLGVFALHFGDKTLPKCTSADEYAAADEAYRQKYRSHVG